MNFGVKMQGGEPASVLKVSESEGKLEGLATAVTPSKNSGSSCGGAISSSSSGSSSRGGSAKGWQYRYGPPKGCSGADAGGLGGRGVSAYCSRKAASEAADNLSWSQTCFHEQDSLHSEIHSTGIC